MGSYSPPSAKTFNPVNPFGQTNTGTVTQSSPVADAPKQSTFSPDTWNTLPGTVANQAQPATNTKPDPFAPFGDYYDWSQQHRNKMGWMWGLVSEDQKKNAFLQQNS